VCIKPKSASIFAQGNYSVRPDQASSTFMRI